MVRTRSGRHIFRRGEIWYYRRVVPEELRPAFGCSAVAVSLNTTSETEAERNEKIHDVDFENRLRAARDSADPVAIAEKIAAGVHIEPWASVNPYRRATRALAETPLTDDARAIAAEIIGERLEQRFSHRQAGFTFGESTSPPPTVTNDTHTLAWAYDRWFRLGEGDRKADSVKTALRHWKAFLVHSKLNMLADVRRSHILAWRDSLTDAGEHASKSINQRLQLVIAILRAGWRDAECPSLT